MASPSCPGLSPSHRWCGRGVWRCVRRCVKFPWAVLGLWRPSGSMPSVTTEPSSAPRRRRGPTARRSQPRALRGTSKPWVWMTTHHRTQGRALKERRRWGERGCVVHGRVSRSTRFPAPIQGATLAQGVRLAGDPGQYSPRLGPPWADSCGPSGRAIQSPWVSSRPHKRPAWREWWQIERICARPLLVVAL